jgi:hypothetical protein
MFRFSHNRLYPQLFFSPDIPTGGGNNTPPTGEMGKEEVIKFLGEDGDDDEKEEKPEVIDLKPKKDTKETDKQDEVDDDEKDEKEDKEDKEADEVEIDELAELEKELQEPTDEQLELVTPVRRKEILAKYPKLFEDFPYLEKAYYREQQFTQLLPTIQDAKDAVEKSKVLDRFEMDLTEGNTENVLRAVKGVDTKAFNNLVDNYLPNLAKVDEAAYHHVIGNTIKHTIISMVKESRRSGNDSLQNAAHLLNQFVFGSTEFAPPSQLSSIEKAEDNAKEREFNEKQEKFTKQRQENANTDVMVRIDKTLKSTIQSYIDPKQSMSDYVRKNATRDAFDTLDSLIKRDARLKTVVDKLWERAKKSDFAKSDLDLIKSAYLSKARTLLPSVIKKARNEALKGMGKRVVADKADKSDDDDDNKEEKPTREPKSSSRSNKSDRGGVPAGMSSLEFLMQD